MDRKTKEYKGNNNAALKHKNFKGGGNYINFGGKSNKVSPNENNDKNTINKETGKPPRGVREDSVVLDVKEPGHKRSNSDIGMTPVPGPSNQMDRPRSTGDIGRDRMTPVPVHIPIWQRPFKLYKYKEYKAKTFDFSKSELPKYKPYNKLHTYDKIHKYKLTPWNFYLLYQGHGQNGKLAWPEKEDRPSKEKQGPERKYEETPQKENLTENHPEKKTAAVVAVAAVEKPVDRKENEELEKKKEKTKGETPRPSSAKSQTHSENDLKAAAVGVAPVETVPKHENTAENDEMNQSKDNVPKEQPKKNTSKLAPVVVAAATPAGVGAMAITKKKPKAEEPKSKPGKNGLPNVREYETAHVYGKARTYEKAKPYESAHKYDHLHVHQYKEYWGGSKKKPKTAFVAAGNAAIITASNKKAESPKEKGEKKEKIKTTDSQASAKTNDPQTSKSNNNTANNVEKVAVVGAIAATNVDKQELHKNETKPRKDNISKNENKKKNTSKLAPVVVAAAVPAGVGAMAVKKGNQSLEPKSTIKENGFPAVREYETAHVYGKARTYEKAKTYDSVHKYDHLHVHKYREYCNFGTTKKKPTKPGERERQEEEKNSKKRDDKQKENNKKKQEKEEKKQQKEKEKREKKEQKEQEKRQKQTEKERKQREKEENKKQMLAAGGVVAVASHSKKDQKVPDNSTKQVAEEPQKIQENTEDRMEYFGPVPAAAVVAGSTIENNKNDENQQTDQLEKSRKENESSIQEEKEIIPGKLCTVF